MLFILALIAWAVTIEQSAQMRDMALGIAQIGRRMPLAMSAPVFFAMWITMMVAMMFPTIGPMVLAHRMVVAQRGEGTIPTVVFVLGYLVAWTVLGSIPFAALLFFRNVVAQTAPPTWIAILCGVALMVAGLYQFTPWKAVCLRACRSPLGFILTHDFKTGVRGAWRAGLTHGAYCIGCCWALMSVLFVMGLMNLVWMALITILFIAEKNWRYGGGLIFIVGPALALIGLLIVANPDILLALSGE